MSTVGPGGADWEDIYAGDGTDPADFDHRLLSSALRLAPGNALDLGCGAGGNAIGLAKRGWSTTGVDASSKAIRSARINAAAARVPVQFVVADIRTWKSETLYDLILISYALPPRGPDRTRVLSLAAGHLAPAGTLIVGEWHGEGDHPDHIATPTELAGALAHLEIVSAEWVRVPPEGYTGDRDRWRAVIVVARRASPGARYPYRPPAGPPGRQ